MDQLKYNNNFKVLNSLDKILNKCILTSSFACAYTLTENFQDIQDDKNSICNLTQLQKRGYTILGITQQALLKEACQLKLIFDTLKG